MTKFCEYDTIFHDHIKSLPEILLLGFCTDATHLLAANGSFHCVSPRDCLQSKVCTGTDEVRTLRTQKYQHHGSIMLWGSFAAGLHNASALCRYFETSSEDMSQEAKAWIQMGLSARQWFEAYLHNGNKMASGLRSKILEWPSKTWLSCISSAKSNEPKFLKNVVQSLWKATPSV